MVEKGKDRSYEDRKMKGEKAVNSGYLIKSVFTIH